MPKSALWLGTLLAVQIVMAVGFNLSTLRPPALSGMEPLIAVEQTQINRIVLEGPEHAKVELVKEGTAWTLPQLERFPADSNKVRAMLDKLTAAKAGQPVATTSEAKTRFKVNDEAFERRITLAENEKTLATLYVGSSAGFRRSYVRSGDQENIFSFEVAAYDIPVRLEDWEDKTVVRPAKSEITAIEVAGLRIEQAVQPPPSSPDTKTDNSAHQAGSPLVWKVTEFPKGTQAELKADAVDKLIRALTELSFDKVLGRNPSEEYGIDRPLLTIRLFRKTGDPTTYLVGKNPKKEEYTLKVSDRPEYFRLLSYQVTGLLEAADRKQLLNTSSGAPGPTKS